MESGKYNTEDLPSDAKEALQKKFNSTGYTMRDEIVASFRSYLQDRDQDKLFEAVGQIVQRRMVTLNSKVEVCSSDLPSTDDELYSYFQAVKIGW